MSDRIWLLIGVGAAAMSFVVFCLMPLLAVGVDYIRRMPRRCLFGAVCILLALYGGSKGRVTVDDDYIRDDGSYLTNDVVHIAIARRSLLLPDSTEILVYARPETSTNVADWVRLTPHMTFADHPYDYALANATNYNVLVAASYTPAPTVHTNGVWLIRGFEISDEPGKFAFPNSRIKVKELNINRE